jgi:acyl carrier protein
MNKDQVLVEVNTIFREVFNDPQLQIDLGTAAKDVANWDSMNNLFLIDALEQRFKFKYTLDEMMNAQNVGELIDIIVSRGQ